MKHFVEARQSVLSELPNAVIQPLVERLCAIFDLRGMCRILAKPVAEQNEATVETHLRQVFSQAADNFWAGEVWLDTVGTSPSKRAVFNAAWHRAVPYPAGHLRHFLLDRRLSKDSWLGTPLSPPWPLNEHTPPILSFYSFKGGVGRTTALVAVAVNLSRAGKRVIVLDFDLESPGAGTTVISGSGQTSSYGIVDFRLEWAVIPDKEMNIAEYSHTCDDTRVIGNGLEIVVVPAGRVDQDYLEKLARINYDFLYRTASEPNAPESPLHALLKKLRSHWKPDYFLIDSRAGLHDLGGLSLSGLAHWNVLFGLNSEQSWQGLTIAVDHLGKQEVLADRVQRYCTLVHALAPTPGLLRDQAVQSFKERAYGVFKTAYFDAPDATDAEWPIPDIDTDDSPHFPAILTWDNRVHGYQRLADIADILGEGEFKSLTNHLLDRLGRTTI